jgi:cytochrome c peroxidase
MRAQVFPVVIASLAINCPLCAADALMTAAQAQFKPIPMTAPALPGNPATPAKVLLGKMLFFDPRLSASHAISCNSCHNIGLGGVDDQETSIGHHWQRGGRNSPTVFNAVFNTAQFWDGRAKDLEAQAGGPMVNPVEMASPTAHVAEQLSATPGYVTAFQSAFPGTPGPVTLENAQRAIAVFEATLITPNALCSALHNLFNAANIVMRTLVPESPSFLLL